MGGVYLCHDRDMAGRRSVIKILSTLIERTSLTPDITTELGLSQLVNHPNVLSGREFFRDNDFIAYSMDYIENGSLAEILDGKPLETPLALDFLSQICSGVAAIHSAGILHRDIKPDNVLLTPSGQVKISDFGVAVRSSGSHCSPEESLSGTLNYLPPEYLVWGKFDTRSDIYSIGVLAYEMVTGKLPFDGLSMMDTLVQRVKFDPVPPSRINNRISPQLSNLILSSMHREPHRRPTSAHLLRDMLTEIRVREPKLLPSAQSPSDGTVAA